MSVAARHCPYCGAELHVRDGRCPGCDGDLAPLRRIDELADRHVNDALTAAARRDWAMAREHLAVATVLNPVDIDAAMLLGKVRFQHGDRELAVETWRSVLRVEPDHAGARAAIEHDAVRRASERHQQSRRSRRRRRRAR